jgi:CheY-like chemotaxis protein
MHAKANILIVDDDAAVGETLSDILAEKGYKVVAATDGLEIIDEVKKQHFDLALIDIMMSGMNGVETLQMIKELDPDVTTMIMTGHSGMEKPISEALAAGVDRVLFKPFNVEGVVDLISREVGAPTEDVGMPTVDREER